MTSYIICAIFKVVLARYRPIELFQHQLYGFHGFSLKHNFNSTPSGHASEAFAGLYALSLFYKKTWLTGFFLLMALLIALSRVIETDHFLSDVIFGGYVGILSVIWVKHIIHWRKTLTTGESA